MWEPDRRWGGNSERRIAALVIVSLLLGSVLGSGLATAVPVEAVPPVPPAETTCRVRHTVEDPEAFAVVVAQQRADHLQRSFDRDAVYNDLVVDEFIVPTDLSRFIDQPLSLRPISSGGEWGYRVHPIYRRLRFHNGLDVGAASGSPVQSMGDGTVAISAYRGGYGNLVAVDHGDGFATLYAHLSRRDVEVGDVITAGQVIGGIGSTGASTGPHLHFETRLAGVPVDPRWFVPILATPATPTGSTRVPEWPVAVGGEAARHQIARLYLAAFDRLAHEDELAHWIGQCRVGVTLEAIAAVALLDAGVVARLGQIQPAELVARSESAETQEAHADLLLPPEVRRMYLAVLGREPDVSGIYHWSSLLERGVSLVAMAATLGLSDEYSNGLVAAPIASSSKSSTNCSSVGDPTLTDWTIGLIEWRLKVSGLCWLTLSSPMRAEPDWGDFSNQPETPIA